MKIAVNVKQRFRVPATPEQSFALLADVPRSISHFPNLQRLVPQGEGVYRWEMEPVAAVGVSHQLVYACRYASDAGAARVTWTPVANVGNGQIEGAWELLAEGGGTLIRFYTSGALEVPVPALFRPMAAPFVQGLFRNEVSRYLDNIRRALSA